MPSQVERLAWLARHIDALPGTGIIYTLTTRDAERVGEMARRETAYPPRRTMPV